MNLRTRLAQATGAAHGALERELALEGDVGLDRYGWYLQAMQRVLGAVEEEMASYARLRDLGLGLASRRKAPWLDADLRHLGLGASPARDAPRLPADPASRVGWAYVLEGSTLGGRVLFRRLAPRFALTPGRGGAFLHGYGERTARMWEAFVLALNAIDFTPEEEKACIAGATHAFTAIGAAFRSVAGAGLGIGGERGGGLAA